MPRKRIKPKGLKVKTAGRTKLQEVYDAHAVVLENIDSQIAVLVEGFSALNESLSRLEKRFDNLEADMQFMKDELRLIRYELKEKTSLTDLRALEQRVTKIERQLAHR